MAATDETLVVGLVSVSDRASKGEYKDEGIPALKTWLAEAIAAPAWRDETRLIADEQPVIEATLKELVDLRGLSPRAHHRWHRAGAARRHARGDARGRRQADARIRRADATDQPAASCQPRSCRARWP